MADWVLRQRIKTSVGSVAYDIFGEGSPVVLIHGTPSWSYLWRHVVPTLSERSTVYVYDLLGYGESEKGDGQDVSIVAQSRLLIELLDRWQLEAPAIAGHDIGGAITLRAHLLEKRPFSRLALIDAVVMKPWITEVSRHAQAYLEAYQTMPVHIYEQIVATHLGTAVYKTMNPETLAAYLKPWKGKSGQVAYFSQVAQFNEQHTDPLEPLLKSIDLPVSIIWGEHDAWLDPSVAARLREMIPHSEVRIIPEAGHFSMEDAPEAVAQELVEFFVEG